jgi:hypothetical protein
VRFAAEVYQVASASRAATARRHVHPDQRFVIFHEMSGLAHALLLGAMHLRSHGSDPAWWDLQPELTHQVDGLTMASNNMALRQVLHLGYAQGILRQMDMALRQYAAALQRKPGDYRSAVPDEGSHSAKTPLRKVWKEVVTACEVPEYAPLLGLLQVHRDGISQLGRFCPVDGQDLQIVYKGQRYHFYASQEIEPSNYGFVDDWDFLRFIVLECDQMLHRLHGSAPLSALTLIQTRYLS